MDDYICFMFSFGSAYHIFQTNTKYKTHFYTFLHMCKWFFWVYTCVSVFVGVYTCVSGFFGLHMCKWFFFDLHILTHPYTSIHVHTHSGIF